MSLDNVGWLPWTWALGLAIITLAAAYVLRKSSKSLKTSDLLMQVTLMLLLYAAWQYVGSLSVGGVENADSAGMWIADFQASLRWPSEQSIQQSALNAPWLILFADLYYMLAHVPVFLITLAWVLFARRDDWPFARTTVVLLTGMCLLLQFKPVAPPRLLPELGIVDTAITNGRSVYGAIAGANELSAMPSVHIAWSAAVALLIIVIAQTPWRWLALIYPLLTLWVVVVTGNHFILDGVVAVILLGIAVSITLSIPSQRPRRWRTSRVQNNDLNSTKDFPDKAPHN